MSRKRHRHRFNGDPSFAFLIIGLPIILALVLYILGGLSK